VRGHFITFEGGEGAGKSSLIIGLHAALIEKGHQVIQTRAPGGTEPGRVIRDLLLHPQVPVVPKAELFLYLADRAQHVEKVILPALEEGKVVLCDRFNDSTIAYQGGGREFGMEKVAELCRFASSGLTPDLTLYLDLDPEIGLQRIKEATGRKDQIEAEALQFHQKIRHCFHQMAQKGGRFRIIDASLSREEVFQEALRIIDAYCFAPNA
jgi:dTMP kinase